MEIIFTLLILFSLISTLTANQGDPLAPALFALQSIPLWQYAIVERKGNVAKIKLGKAEYTLTVEGVLKGGFGRHVGRFVNGEWIFY